jgi:hypothetical protein
MISPPSFAAQVSDIFHALTAHICSPGIPDMGIVSPHNASAVIAVPIDKSFGCQLKMPGHVIPGCRDLLQICAVVALGMLAAGVTAALRTLTPPTP